MKELYISPEVEIVKFYAAANIASVKTGSNDDDIVMGGGGSGEGLKIGGGITPVY